MKNLKTALLFTLVLIGVHGFNSISSQASESFQNENYLFPHVHLGPDESGTVCFTDQGITLCENGQQCTSSWDETECNDGSVHSHRGPVTDCDLDRVRCVKWDQVTRCDDGLTCYHEKKTTTCTRI